MVLCLQEVVEWAYLETSGLGFNVYGRGLEFRALGLGFIGRLVFRVTPKT